MISIENLSIEFSARPLFTGANFNINPHDRIALVGKNGAGKSTLLKILSGQQHATSGSISSPEGTTFGYLPQVMKLSDSTTVIDETRKAFAHVIEMQQQVKQLEDEMNQRTDYGSETYLDLVNRYSSLHERYQLFAADAQEGELERTLIGLGFSRNDLNRPTAEFSGGWRMRIELAKILLQRPDVLLLDEPTNHLDIDSIQWLEQFLAQSGSAVVLVSHDRAFINNVTNRTLEISAGRIIDYKVRYQEYLVLRQERREQQLRAYENQKKEMADMRAFIERFRYQATKAVQVQQKVKQLAKMVPIEIDELDNKAMHLKFPPCLRSGDYPIICQDVSKTYGQHNVFHDVSLTINRGEKVAFVGRNGEGKTTLVKCIMGEIPFDGMLKVGHNVQIGYFAQNQAQLLDDSLTVFETIDRVARGDIRLKINDLLGAFMFGGEESDKRVKVLSGGERSRLALIKLLLEPVNLLILDEPTNHLDMASKDVLKEALLAFDGTEIVVSHDREFLDGLVTKVYEFGEGRVREHMGGIYDFLRKRRLSSLSQLTSSPTTIQVEQNTQSTNKVAYAERKEQQKQIRKVERQVAETEEKIAKFEARIKEMDRLLATDEHATDMKLIEEYSAVMRSLDEENGRWMDLSEKLELLRAEISD